MLKRKIHADFLHLICGVSNARCVPEHDWQSFDIYRFFNHVSRRPREGRNDHAVVSKQSVQQARFTDIRSSTYTYPCAIAEEPPTLISIENITSFIHEGTSLVDQLIALEQLNFLFGKI